MLLELLTVLPEEVCVYVCVYKCMYCTCMCECMHLGTRAVMKAEIEVFISTSMYAYTYFIL